MDHRRGAPRSARGYGTGGAGSGGGRGGRGPGSRRYNVRLSLWITEQMVEAVERLAVREERDIPDMYRRCLRAGIEAIERALHPSHR